MKKIVLAFLLVIFLASVLRLWRLGQVPSSMADDEVRLTYSAYSIWNTGKDLRGFVFPLSFLIDGYSFNPIPIYLTSPFVGLLGLSMFSARLPFALVGILTIFLVYKIANQLIKERTIAILSSFVLTFSAWHLQISRFSYEGQFALFFFALGIYSFLKIKKNSIWNLVIPTVSFLVAFYSYSGTKIIWLPIILILVWYGKNKLSFKQLAFIASGVAITILSFILLSKYQSASSYGHSTFFFQKPGVEMVVELERRASLAPEFFKKIYHNKLTYWSKIFVNQYTYALSPQYLFTSQEGNGIFSIWFRGEMYFIEAPLILLGLLYLFQKRRKELLLIILFLVIAPIPSALGSDPVTYTIRSSFMLPWLSILVGAGIYSISYFIKKLNLRIALYALLLFSYVYFIGGYLSQYYFEWVIYGPKYYSKATQDAVLFANKEKKKNKNIFISPADKITLLNFAFYNRMSPALVQKLYQQKDVSFDNIIFKRDCVDISIDPTIEDSALLVSISCSGSENYIRTPYNIIRSLDNLDEWLIFRE